VADKRKDIALHERKKRSYSKRKKPAVTFAKAKRDGHSRRGMEGQKKKAKERLTKPERRFQLQIISWGAVVDGETRKNEKQKGRSGNKKGEKRPTHTHLEPLTN